MSDVEEHKIESDIVNGNGNVSSNGSNIKITVQQNGYELKNNSNGQIINGNGSS